jgi:putative FmdB family regulatory protein
VPTYQYACTECGHAFEQFQNFSDDTLTVCPSCEGRLRKVFNAVGVVFKGSGFYRNDSRKADTSALSSASSATDSSSSTPSTGEKSGTTEKKSESTTATKTEKKSDSSSSNGSSSAA